MQRLLNLCAAAGRLEIDDDALKTDGVFGLKTLKAIMAFQRSAFGEQAPKQPGRPRRAGGDELV